MDEIAEGTFRVFELPVTIACDGSTFVQASCARLQVT